MKVKSFIRFLLSQFDENDDIEFLPAYGDCSIRKIVACEKDDSFIWITDKYDKDNETSYNSDMIEKIANDML